ncbi:glycosyltransferase family 87 protein [Paraburkholderia silvatlantica]|uniref:glycosyltransferase family 87 protein n=1 Tax=Paraburkholderia silvatlantica TaxID=321895 RepID=UPI003751D28D
MDTLMAKSERRSSSFFPSESLAYCCAAILFLQLAILIMWGAACWILHIRYVLPLGIDFRAFWGASFVSLHHGALAAFDPRLLLAAERLAFSTSSLDLDVALWVYPPPFQLVIYPLALATYPVAYALFSCLSLLSCLLACRPVMKAKPLPWIAVIAFPGIWVAILQGQNSLITLALAAGAVGLVGTRPIVAGMCAGLLVIKPQLAPVFPIMFLCGRHFRAFTAAVLTVLVVCGASTLILGLPLWAEFFRILAQFNSTMLTHGGDRMWGAMPTIFAVTRRAGANVQTAYLVHYAIALFGLLLSMRLWIKYPHHGMSASAAIIVALMLSPYLLYYDLAWLLLPILFLCDDFQRRPEQVIPGYILVALAWIIPIPSLLSVFWFHSEQWATFLLPALLVVTWHRSRALGPKPPMCRHMVRLARDCPENLGSHTGNPDRRAA